MRIVQHSLVVVLVTSVGAVALAAVPVTTKQKGASATPGSQVQVCRVPAPPAPFVPAPCPNLGDTSCARVPALKEALDQAIARVAAEAKKATLDDGAQRAVSQAIVTAANASCCTAMSLDAAATAAAMGVFTPLGTTQCQTLLSAVKGKPPTMSPAESYQACASTSTTARDAAESAGSSSLAAPLKAALEELAAAENRLAAALRTCESKATKPAGPPPPPSAPKVGEACSSVPCQGSLCVNGTCRVVGVPPSGACDANHLCLPGLECRGGQCRLPCGCPVGCTPKDGGCVREVAGTTSVRKDCNRIRGACVPPCFTDGSGACKVDTTQVTSRTESCSPVCP